MSETVIESGLRIYPANNGPSNTALARDEEIFTRRMYHGANHVQTGADISVNIGVDRNVTISATRIFIDGRQVVDTSDGAFSFTAPAGQTIYVMAKRDGSLVYRDTNNPATDNDLLLYTIVVGATAVTSYTDNRRFAAFADVGLGDNEYLYLSSDQSVKMRYASASSRVELTGNFYVSGTTQFNGNVGIGAGAGSMPLYAFSSAATQARFERDGGTAGTRGKLDVFHSNFGFSGDTGADSILLAHWGFGIQVNNQSTAITILSASNNGNVVVGPAAQNAAFGLFNVAKDTANVGVYISGAGTNGTSSLYLRQATTSHAAPGSVGTTQEIGQILASANSGGTYFDRSGISFFIDGAFTSGEAPPVAIYFYTNAANGARAERMRITSSGSVGIGATPTSNRVFRIGGSWTASSGVMLAQEINPTLNAAANGNSLYGLYVAPTIVTNAFGSLTGYGIKIATWAANITNYALHIDAPTGSGTNYALYVASGNSRLGANVAINSDPSTVYGFINNGAANAGSGTSATAFYNPAAVTGTATGVFLYGIHSQTPFSVGVNSSIIWFATIGGSDQGGATIATNNFSVSRLKGLEVNLSTVSKTGSGVITDAWAGYFVAGTFATNNYALYTSGFVEHSGTVSGNNAELLQMSGTLQATANGDTIRTINLQNTFSKSTFTGLTTTGLFVSQMSVTGTGTISSMRGIFIETQNIAATNSYALYVKAPTGGTTANYSIYVENGLTVLGGQVAIGTSSIGTTYGVVVQVPITAGSGVGYGMAIQGTYTAAATNDQLRGLHIQPTFAKGTGLTGLQATGLYIDGQNFGVSGTSTISAAYALSITAPTIGTTNYSIVTNGGLAGFGSTPGANELFRLGGTMSGQSNPTGFYINATITANANNDALRSAYITPTFAKNGKTGLSAYGFFIDGANFGVSGSGTIDEAYGLYITPPSGLGTRNFAIFVTGGESRFLGSIRVAASSTSAIVSTSATGPFLFTTQMAGTPTGDPGDSGAIVLDTTNHRLYVRDGGSWRYAALT